MTKPKIRYEPGSTVYTQKGHQAEYKFLAPDGSHVIMLQAEATIEDSYYGDVDQTVDIGLDIVEKLFTNPPQAAYHEEIRGLREIIDGLKIEIDSLDKDLKELTDKRRRVKRSVDDYVKKRTQLLEELQKNG